MLGKRVAGGLKEYRSYCFGNYRIIYAFADEKVTVYILFVSQRKDVYKKFSGKIISLDKLMLDENRRRYRKRKTAGKKSAWQAQRPFVQSKNPRSTQLAACAGI